MNGIEMNFFSMGQMKCSRLEREKAHTQPIGETVVIAV